MNKEEKRAVILLSGGIDSTVAAYMLKEWGYKLEGIFFDYGQRAVKELVCARKIAGTTCETYKRVSLFLCKLWDSPLVNSNVADSLKEPPVIPFRNFIFLTIASSYAVERGINEVVIGVNQDDIEAFPDCQDRSLDSLTDALRNTLDKNIQLLPFHNPVSSKTKVEILEKAYELGVPLGNTYSCYKKNPCGTCYSCYERLKAFDELGKRDPLMEKYVEKRGE